MTCCYAVKLLLEELPGASGTTEHTAGTMPSMSTDEPEEVETEFDGEQPRPARRWPHVVWAVLMLAVFIAGGWFLLRDSGLKMPAIGECIAGKEGMQERPAIIACDDESTGVPYKAVSTHDGEADCDNPAYVAYVVTNVQTDKVSKTICLAPQLQKDHCYDESSDFLAPIACDAATDSSFKVVDIVEKADDACVAHNKSQPISLADPAPGRTYCIGDVK